MRRSPSLERSPLNQSLWEIVRIDREIAEIRARPVLEADDVSKFNSLRKERKMHKGFIQSYKPREIV